MSVPSPLMGTGFCSHGVEGRQVVPPVCDIGEASSSLARPTFLLTPGFPVSYVPVAQLDRASPSEGEGHRFESCRERFGYVAQLDRAPVYETGSRRFKSCHTRYALVVQWIEHRSSEPSVGGSNPSEGACGLVVYWLGSWSFNPRKWVQFPPRSLVV